MRTFKTIYSTRLSCDRCGAVEDVITETAERAHLENENRARQKWAILRVISSGSPMVTLVTKDKADIVDLCPRCREKLLEWYLNPTCKVLSPVQDEVDGGI